MNTRLSTIKARLNGAVTPTAGKRRTVEPTKRLIQSIGRAEPPSCARVASRSSIRLKHMQLSAAASRTPRLLRCATIGILIVEDGRAHHDGLASAHYPFLRLLSELLSFFKRPKKTHYIVLHDIRSETPVTLPAADG